MAGSECYYLLECIPRSVGGHVPDPEGASSFRHEGVSRVAGSRVLARI